MNALRNLLARISQNGGGRAMNIAAGLMLVLTACLLCTMGALFLNPALAPAPFRVASAPVTSALPTPTGTSLLPTLPPAWTATLPLPTGTPVPTFTPAPTGTPAPTVTLVPTRTPTGTATASATPTATPTPTPAVSATPTPLFFPPGGFVAPVITNPSFESGATTDGNGNQVALGWAASAPIKGQSLPYATKNEQGKVVAAVSDGPGQFMLRQASQAAVDEVPGQPRAVILDGSTSYLITGPAGAHALRLTQTLSGAPGTSIRVTAYIMGETSDQPGGGATKLEDDHFVASLGLGDMLDRRQYAQMVARFDVAGNTRPWNRFVVEATFPAQGQLVLTLIVQQNWAGNTFFYVDNLNLEVLP